MASFSEFLGVNPWWGALWWAALPFTPIPAIVNWWSTRHLAEGDPALPERHLALAQRTSSVTAACTMATVVLAGWHSLWILPLQFLALASTRYRTRQKLFGETWPFNRYVLWRVRVFCAQMAFWLLTAMAPALVASAGDGARWWIAAAAVALIVAWYHWHARLILMVFGASRLERRDLDSLFHDVCASATVPPPTLWRAGAAGGMFANALALPSLNGSAVLFFDTLLERLSREEIAAILAHEIAHLEYYNRRRLSILYAAGITLILALFAGAAILGDLAPELTSWMPMISFIAVFGGLWLRARRMQPKETEADLRAVELCGNPEALVTGLTRLHVINHVPRRWSAHMEEHATHPSLARRIRAIRGQSNTSPAPVSIERILIASPESGRCAVVDADRVAFLTYGGAMSEPISTILDRAHRAEVLAYSELSELRLAATHSGALTLTAVDRHARRWSLPIHAADATRLQALLDLVDHKLAATTRRTPSVDLGRRFTVLLVLSVAAVFNALTPALVPAVLALRRATRPLLIALAVALTSASLLTAGDLFVSVTRVGVLAVMALFALWHAQFRTEDEPGPNGSVWGRIETAALALPVVIGVILITLNARDLFGLHEAVRDRSWFVAATLAFAAYLSLSTQGRSRRVAALAGAAAVIAMGIGSPWFVVSAVSDPLVAAMAPLEEEHVPLTLLSRRSVEGSFSSMQLGADGDTFLLLRYDDEDGTHWRYGDEIAPFTPQRFVVGGFSGWSRELRVVDASLIDDARLLVLDRRDALSWVRAEDLRTGKILWTLPLPLDASSIQATADGRWRAFVRQGNQFTRIEGRVGAEETQQTQWAFEARPNMFVDHPRVGNGAVALGVASTFSEPPTSWLRTEWQTDTTLFLADSKHATWLATSRLGLDCPRTPMGIDGYVCISFDGRWSRWWRIDVATRQLIPVGETHGHVWNASYVTSTRLSASINGNPAIISLESKRVQILAPVRDNCGAAEFSVTANLVITACPAMGTTTLTLYRRPADR
jgi:heat shock protein HtpX